VLEDAFPDIHKLLAHPSYSRGKLARDWLHDAIYDELEGNWRRFLDQLAVDEPELRKLFSERRTGMRMVQPTQVDGYLIVARDLLQGVAALSTLPNVPPRVAASAAAHALECALKAFLAHKGKTSEIRKRDVQHNLLALWDMAYQEHDLGIPQAPPSWVAILSSGHGPIFYFRYQEGPGGIIVHGGQTPEPISMATELNELIATVGQAVGR
jgi:hypothetical protein